MEVERRFVARLQKSGDSLKIEIPKAIRKEVRRLFEHQEIEIILRKSEVESAE
jgi:hypothetical protein